MLFFELAEDGLDLFATFQAAEGREPVRVILLFSLELEAAADHLEFR